jgi:hypothetical protein
VSKETYYSVDIDSAPCNVINGAPCKSLVCLSGVLFSYSSFVFSAAKCQTWSTPCHIITHMPHHHTHVTSSHTCHIITHMSHHRTHATSSHTCHIIAHMSHHHTHVTSSHTCHIITHMSHHRTHVTSSHTCHTWGTACCERDLECDFKGIKRDLIVKET